MHTIIFVIDNAGRHGIGYNLSRRNLYYAPKGRIHIARFTTAFDPINGLGYLGDTYMRAFIRKWKDKVRKKKRQIEIQSSLPCLINKTDKDLRYILCNIYTFL